MPALLKTPPHQENEPARVMICDDSVVIRGAIARMLEDDPNIRVVARAANGAAGLEAMRTHKIDVVILDIEMPIMDGMTALPAMLRLDPAVRIIMASTLTTRGADIALRALRLGAADYIPKPSAAELAGDGRFREELLGKIHGLTRQRRPAPAVSPRGTPLYALRPPPRRAPRLLAIGSSTGGPNALFTLFQALSGTINVPIILTQHMPPTFTTILAEHISKLGIRPCGEARDGEKLLPGQIALAPGDRHMLVRQHGGSLSTTLSSAPMENFCRPAVDPMLRTACEATEGRVLVVMLTGMGQDGMLGTRQIVEAGGCALAQDEASSVVWGMPGAVARAGLAHAVLPLTSLAGKIMEMLATTGSGAR